MFSVVFWGYEPFDFTQKQTGVAPKFGVTPVVVSQNIFCLPRVRHRPFLPYHRHPDLAGVLHFVLDFLRDHE